MRKDIHRRLRDIPAQSCDDPNLYPGYNSNPFQKHIIDLYNAIGYNYKMKRAGDVHMVYNDGKYKRVVRVSRVQQICYKSIELFFKSSGQIKVAAFILEEIYQKSTIKALIKKGLLFESITGEIKLHRIN